MIKIQTENFCVTSEIDKLTKDKAIIGGVVSFVGTVRDYTDNDDVTALVLEHYPGMTESELQKIETAAMAQFAVEEIAVIHRVGRLKPGENIVLVIAASRHRSAAFDACRYVIDHLKVHATFWKKEVLKGGKEKWIDSCPGCEAAASQWKSNEPVQHTHPTDDETVATDNTETDVNSHKHKNHHKSSHHHHGSHQSSWAGLQVGILTMSDSRSLANDKSGDALEGEIRSLGATLTARDIIADDKDAISQLLIDWCDNKNLNVILTTGGTGPGPRDVTPEATRAVCDIELPGFSEHIRTEGLKQVRSALLTRGVSAFRGETIVVNLPGSTRGALHSLKSIADLVPHALRMSKGGGH
ncbi:MAG: molybdenum cofactor biosynthesis protein MoaE [Magnetococcales bacterium]|nr:molybdenum cofactor biosynthesis protein MoaE [Magnetococcales bacterium]